jgi:hypothetical protein
MVNMKMSRTEAAEEYGVAPAQAGDAPEYPYGLTLSLCDESLKKLGITSLPAVGSTMTLHAMVTVTSVSSNETQAGGVDQCVGLQITDMDLSGPARDQATRLYGG